jgi:hypothetical protein
VIWRVIRQSGHVVTATGPKTLETTALPNIVPTLPIARTFGVSHTTLGRL